MELYLTFEMVPVWWGYGSHYDARVEKLESDGVVVWVVEPNLKLKLKLSGDSYNLKLRDMVCLHLGDDSNASLEQVHANIL